MGGGRRERRKAEGERRRVGEAFRQTRVSARAQTKCQQQQVTNPGTDQAAQNREGEEGPALTSETNGAASVRLQRTGWLVADKSVIILVCFISMQLAKVGAGSYHSIEMRRAVDP